MPKFTQTTADLQTEYFANFKDQQNTELSRRANNYNAQMASVWAGAKPQRGTLPIDWQNQQQANEDGLTAPLRIEAFGESALTVFQMAAAERTYLLSQDATLAATLLPAPLTAQDAATWPTRADGTTVVPAYTVEFECPAGEWVNYTDLPAAMQAGKVPTGAARASVVA